MHEEKIKENYNIKILCEKDNTGIKIWRVWLNDQWSELEQELIFVALENNFSDFLRYESQGMLLTYLDIIYLSQAVIYNYWSFW